MEVDRVSFAGRLLDILTAISESHFVSFDLELSGVPSKQASAKAKMTLEQRYQDVKAAAEKYTILQIGITCAKEDYINDSYTLKPYNFNLNPLLEERLDIERIFSFQSGAAEFLINNGFRMELPMTMGVPYLSRDEAKLAKTLAYARFAGSNFEDVQLRPDEVESLEFMRKVRVAIDKWRVDGKPEPSFLKIVSIDPTGPQPEVPSLGRFEKRLVHQLVRAEYPDLVTISKYDMIIIKSMDEIREKSILESKKKALKKQIEKQTGFRWIVEALCGGGQFDIDCRAFARDIQTGEAKFVDMHVLRGNFRQVEMLLARRRPVLVGHNLFTDLIYFYKTFIGKLPDTLAEFKAAIHTLFPVVIDTKYLATHNCGDINPASSLQQIEEKLRTQDKPTIVTDAAHQKYASMDTFHEAGFDSYLTAIVAIRLSAKLDEAGSYKEQTPVGMSEDDAYETAAESVSPSKSAPCLAPGATAASAGMLSNSFANGTDLFAPASSSLRETASEPPATPKGSGKKKKKRRSRAAQEEETTSSDGANGSTRFSHATLFSQLQDMSLDETPAEDGGDEANAETPATPSGAVTGNWDTPDEPAPSFELNGTTYFFPPKTFPTQMKKEPMDLMPPFGTEFWSVYGNKLRVFGTMEGMCHLDE